MFTETQNDLPKKHLSYNFNGCVGSMRCSTISVICWLFIFKNKSTNPYKETENLNSTTNRKKNTNLQEIGDLGGQ